MSRDPERRETQHPQLKAQHSLGAPLSRRDLLRGAAAAIAVAALPGCRPEGAEPAPEPGREALPAERAEPPDAEDERRMAAWIGTLRSEGLDGPAAGVNRAAARVGELAIGTPYEAFTLEEYLRAGGSPMRTEPLTLSLTRFDCVSLVEACLALARVARADGAPSWDAFAREMERMRYRDGERAGYASRLHYFSEWLADGERRGLVRDLGRELGGGPTSGRCASCRRTRTPTRR
jgi:hypothetical protein